MHFGGNMNIYIDNRGGTPIYDQIYSQIKAQIVAGTLREDAPLPSIRSLAKDLKISVITTKRAYDELEREGYLYTVAGKGCFVAKKNLELVREGMLREIEAHLEGAVRLAGACGVRREELAAMLQYLSEDIS